MSIYSTLRFNITISDGHINYTDIYRALKIAQLRDITKEIDKGLDTTSVVMVLDSQVGRGQGLVLIE